MVETAVVEGVPVSADRVGGPWGTPAGRLGAVLVALLGLVGLLAPWLAPHDPFALAGPSLVPPSLAHPMGTDALGRDVSSAVVYGIRTSLVVAAAVGALALAVGVAVGLVAGFAGGRLDDLLMRVTELFQVVPRFFLAIVAIALFGPGIDRLILVLGLTSWTGLARVVRAETLALREMDFVRAARAGGASTRTILLVEILPNAIPPALVLLGLLLGHVLLIEAGLGFLGLGDPNALSLGFLISEAQPFLRVAWWISLFPGLAIMAAVMGLNLLGDALTDVPAWRQ